LVLETKSGLPSNSRQRGFCSDPRKNRSPAITRLDPIVTAIKQKKRTASIARPQNLSMVERPLSLAPRSPGVGRPIIARVPAALIARVAACLLDRYARLRPLLARSIAPRGGERLPPGALDDRPRTVHLAGALPPPARPSTEIVWGRASLVSPPTLARFSLPLVTRLGFPAGIVFASSHRPKI
jgi:hypothetical protein